MTSTKQFWKGKLYRRCVSEDEEFTPPDRRSSVTGCISVFRIEALPFADDIARALDAAPASKTDLLAWQSAWSRSFPGWEQGKAAQSVLSKLTDTLPDRSSVEAISRDIEDFLNRDHHEPALAAFSIEKRARAAVPAAVPPTPEAVLVARTLRAANAFAAFASLMPFTTALKVTIEGVDAGMVVLTGFTDDGLAILGNRYGDDPRLDRDLDGMFSRLGDDTYAPPPFWTWDFLWDHLGRTVFGVCPTDFEAREREIDRDDLERRRIALAGALADMAANGVCQAVFSPRDVNGKAKARALHIENVETIQQALDLIDNVDRFTWSATVEPMEGYMTVNRYFFHGGRMIGSTCVDPKAHPYDRECRNGFDQRLSFGASALIDDGEFAVIDGEHLPPHNEYARKVGDLLRERGILDFALDVGMLNNERTFRVIGVGDLWSAQTYSFDQTVLSKLIADEANEYDSKLDVALDGLAAHPDFSRLTPAFREVVEKYGRGTMIARLIKRSSSVYRGAWNEEQVNSALEEAVVHYVRCSPDDFTDAEEEAAEDRVSFVQYDGFHGWVWKHWWKR